MTNLGASLMYYSTRLDEVMANLALHHLNTLYPAVWNQGNTLHSSAVLRKAVGDRTPQIPFIPDVLSGLVKQAHRQHLRLIPWFEYGLMVPMNSAIAKAHPDWLTRTQGGSSKPDGELNLTYLNPAHPQVQAFLTDLIVEVVRRYPVDGIQLDDHFALPVEMGYDPYTRKLYQGDHGGQSPPSDFLDPEWMAWRAAHVTRLMAKISSAVKEARPGMIVSLSPNPPEYAYRTSLQDWGAWVEKGLIDEAAVQVYRSDLVSLRADLAARSLSRLNAKVPVSIGLYTGPFLKVKPIRQVQKEIEAVREAGFSGVSFFCWETTLWLAKGGSADEVRRSFNLFFTH